MALRLRPGKLGADRYRSVSRQAGLLVYEQPTADNGWDLYMLPLTSDGPPRPLVSTPADDVNGVLSPDGRWVAYVSNPHGTFHAFVQSTAGGGRRRQLTAEQAGAVSMWGPNSDSFYLTMREGGLRRTKLLAGEGKFETGETRVVLSVDDEAFRHRVPETDEYSMVTMTEDKLLVLTHTASPGENAVGHLILGW